MPYINQDFRERLDDMWDADVVCVLGIGAVNYLVTSIIQAWLGDDPRYANYNAAIGVLESVKQELYRRRVAPYEDEKKEENGDVYSRSLGELRGG